MFLGKQLIHTSNSWFVMVMESDFFLSHICSSKKDYISHTLPWKETLLAQRRSNALTGVNTNPYARMNSCLHIHQPKNCMIFSNTFELINSASQSGWFHQPKSSQILDSIKSSTHNFRQVSQYSDFIKALCILQP